jgi:diaminohydroxyphosphoribosylaminopyrimidine deaminase/5-amino-6-(5-phosphoribosylamino)uracil reductase
VVIGTLDPNPDVAGGGAKRLEEHGVQVEIGEEEQACLDLIADFRAWALDARPLVRLKLAATLDGRIAARGGHPAWVTGEQARKRVQDMRAASQAVLVGGGTLRADNPRLTNRSVHGGKQPFAVVLTSRLPDPGEDLFVIQKRAEELVILTSVQQAGSETGSRLRSRGVRIFGLVEDKSGGLDIRAGLHRLYTDLGCTEILCEGGGRLGMELMQAGLADELHLVLAPKVLGDEGGISVASGRRVQSMDQALGWRLISHEQVGRDLWLVYRPA